MVLVILAILMAVLIPALLGWIDKAREQQITTNANAAYVAAQGLADEAYGPLTAPATGLTGKAIQKLTDISKDFTFLATFGAEYDSTSVKAEASKDMYTITTFEYFQDGKLATWNSATGAWVVESDKTATTSTTTSGADVYGTYTK